jgi:hypothetical protein
VYLGVRFAGRDAVRDRIRSVLDNCGVTQHLLGNVTIEFAGDTAYVESAIRGWHQGIGQADGLFYEAFGRYSDRVVRTPEGWRIERREFVRDAFLGTREIFAAQGAAGTEADAAATEGGG